LAKLVGGVAIIKVGAATEIEIKEKKARVEDAMHATRAAVEEDIVPGGGVAFLCAIPALEKLTLDDDEQVGVNIDDAYNRSSRLRNANLHCATLYKVDSIRAVALRKDPLTFLDADDRLAF